MHSAPSRIIPMYYEEGALHEIGDAGGGKRVKDRAILIRVVAAETTAVPAPKSGGGAVAPEL
jgi:hypothetical protein